MFFIGDLIDIICNIITIFAITIFVVLLLIVFLTIPFGIITSLNIADYYFNKSKCNVFVNNSQVYSGACHFVDISSVGENGNSKKVIIYKDIPCLKPLKFYVSESVEVRNAD